MDDGMSTTDLRKTLLCIGGPLSRKRLSIPAELQWFALGNGDQELDSDDGLVDFENIVVSDSSISPDPQASQHAVYVRTKYFTAERGLIEVFTFHESWSCPQQ